MEAINTKRYFVSATLLYKWALMNLTNYYSYPGMQKINISAWEWVKIKSVAANIIINANTAPDLVPFLN